MVREKEKTVLREKEEALAKNKSFVYRGEDKTNTETHGIQRSRQSEAG